MLKFVLRQIIKEVKAGKGVKRKGKGGRRKSKR
jgi:hypothetical protein